VPSGGQELFDLPTITRRFDHAAASEEQALPDFCRLQRPWSRTIARSVRAMI
jgi:hypothetical protein